MMIPLLLALTFGDIGDAFVAIQTLEEASPLLNKVEAEGGFRFRTVNDGPFDAYWSGATRELIINTSRHSSSPTLVASILFELHNAKTDRRIKYLQELAVTGRITRDNFIRKVECMEWKNLCQAVDLLEAGIQKGYFPKESYLPVFKDFEDYLETQHVTGHSGYIGDMYDDVRRVRG